MRIKGINYDTGFISEGTTTREPFDPQLVKREMQIIHDDLHCNAVRVTGGYHSLTREELLELLADSAERAERLRKRGAEILFLTKNEKNGPNGSGWVYN